MPNPGAIVLGLWAPGLEVRYQAVPRTEATVRKGAPSDPAPWGFIPAATLRMVYPSNPRGYFDDDDGADPVHPNERAHEIAADAISAHPRAHAERLPELR